MFSLQAKIETEEESTRRAGESVCFSARFCGCVTKRRPAIDITFPLIRVISARFPLTLLRISSDLALTIVLNLV